MFGMFNKVGVLWSRTSKRIGRVLNKVKETVVWVFHTAVVPILLLVLLLAQKIVYSMYQK